MQENNDINYNIKILVFAEGMQIANNMHLLVSLHQSTWHTTGLSSRSVSRYGHKQHSPRVQFFVESVNQLSTLHIRLEHHLLVYRWEKDVHVSSRLNV